MRSLGLLSALVIAGQEGPATQSGALSFEEISRRIVPNATYVNVDSLVTALQDFQKGLAKSEFETTADYSERLKKAKSGPFGMATSTTATTVLSAHVQLRCSYNADKETFSGSISFGALPKVSLMFIEPVWKSRLTQEEIDRKRETLSRIDQSAASGRDEFARQAGAWYSAEYQRYSSEYVLWIQNHKNFDGAPKGRTVRPQTIYSTFKVSKSDALATKQNLVAMCVFKLSPLAMKGSARPLFAAIFDDPIKNPNGRVVPSLSGAYARVLEFVICDRRSGKVLSRIKPK